MGSAMIDLEIDVQGATTPDGGDVARIALRAGDLTLTRLIRPHEHEPDDYLHAPPAQLAFWLVDNWWRLRWECIPPRGMIPEWRLSHELSAIGGGYVWPRVAVWGEGHRIGLLSRSDPPGVVGPVRYLTDALVFIPADGFESVVDEFLANAVDIYARSDPDRLALHDQVSALHREREDPEIATWRRIEARLGFDPDEAPEQTIQHIASLADRFGSDGVEEAATAAPGIYAAETLEREIDAARASRIECDFGAALSVEPVPWWFKPDLRSAGNAVFVPLHEPADDSLEHAWHIGKRAVPWELAEDVALSVRMALGVKKGPLRNKALAEVLGTSADNLKGKASSVGVLPYGLRLRSEDSQCHRIAVRSRWSHDRRFELARALGDAIWTGRDQLGPLASSRTARQKFQRAFAQSLLCPHHDLVDYIRTSVPGDADIAAAAQHFHVSERVVRTVLVNKGLLQRSRLCPSDQQDMHSEQLAELVDAA
jgi:hypothetical protein